MSAMLDSCSSHWRVVVLCANTLGGAEVFALERMRTFAERYAVLYCNQSLHDQVRQDDRYGDIAISVVASLEPLADRLTWAGLIKAAKELSSVLEAGGVLLGNLRSSAVQLVSKYSRRNLIFVHDNTHYLNAKARLLIAGSAMRSQRVLFPCHHAYRRLPALRLLRGRLSVEYFDSLKRLPKSTLLGDSELRIVNVGRIEPNKDQMYCLAIAGELARHFSSVEVTFLGSISDADYAERLRSFKRPANLALTMRQVTRSEVPALLRSHDIVLHTSPIESLPLVMFEANSVGRPFFARDVGGIPEVLPKEFIINGNLPEAVAVILDYLGLPADREKSAVCGRVIFSESV